MAHYLAERAEQLAESEKASRKSQSDNLSVVEFFCRQSSKTPGQGRAGQGSRGGSGDLASSEVAVAVVVVTDRLLVQITKTLDACVDEDGLFDDRYEPFSAGVTDLAEW